MKRRPSSPSALWKRDQYEQSARFLMDSRRHRVVITDFLPGGPNVKRTSVEFLPDGAWRGFSNLTALYFSPPTRRFPEGSFFALGSTSSLKRPSWSKECVIGVEFDEFPQGDSLLTLSVAKNILSAIRRREYVWLVRASHLRGVLLADFPKN